MSVRARLALGILLYFVAASCGGGGCSGCACMAPIPGGYPTEQRMENAMQVRLTDSGVSFLDQNAAAIVGSLVPGGLNFAVPATSFSGNTLCDCDGCCNVSIGVAGLTLVPTAPDVLSIQPLDVTVLSSDMPLLIPTFLGDVHCNVTIDSSRGSDPADHFTGDLHFNVDGATRRTFLTLDNTHVTMENGDINIGNDGGVGSAVACGVIDLVLPLFSGMLTDRLTGPLQDAMTRACVKCGADATPPQDPVSPVCPQGDACAGSPNVCMMNATQCDQSLGTEGRVNVSLGAYSGGHHGRLDLLAWLGGYAHAENGGMTLGMLGGFNPVAHDPCVPIRTPPTVDPPPVSVDLSGNGLDGLTYDVAFGIHQNHLDRAGFAAFDAGSLCLSVGPQAPRVGTFLNSNNLFTVLRIDGSDLLPDLQTVPMAIEVRPQQAPTFAVGDGTLSYDMDGTAHIVSPLLTVNLADLGLDFYALIEERWVRLFTVTADVALPMALDFATQGEVIPLIGSLSQAFSNIRVSNADLLHESPAQLQAMFPVLFSLVATQAPSSIPPLHLPDLRGFSLVNAQARGVEGDTVLAILSDLAFSPPAMASYVVDTTAEVAKVESGPTESFALGRDPDVRVTLAVGGHAPPGARLEWQTRVDGGFWSPFSRPTGGTLVVQSELFRLQGRHAIDVRAREQAVPDTLDPQPAQVEALIDTVAPELVAEDSGEAVAVRATDALSPPDRILLTWTLDGVSGRGESGQAIVKLPPGGAFDTLVVEARDEAGNAARREFHGRVPIAPSSCGCVLGAPATSGALPLCALLIALVAVRRRARGGVA